MSGQFGFQREFSWARAGDAKSNDATRPSRSLVLARGEPGQPLAPQCLRPLGGMELVDGKVGQQARKLAAVL